MRARKATKTAGTMRLAKIEAAALKATADLSGRLGRIEGLREARGRRD